MAEQTLASAIRKPAPVTLSTGAVVQPRKVLLLDLDDFAGTYSVILALLRDKLGRELDEDTVAANMPLFLAVRLRAGDGGILEFLALLCDESADELGKALEGVDLGDIEALWAAVYEANERPFGWSLSDFSSTQAEAILALLSASDAGESSPPDCTPPDSTQET